MASFATPLFYNLLSKKSATKATIAKDFSNYQTTVVQAMPHDDYCILRVARCYKVKLLARFVMSTLAEVYLDANKV